jgi:hypothetical protein
MSLMSSADQRSTLGLHSLERYEPLIGAATAERILRKWIAFARFGSHMSVRRSMPAALQKF